VKFLDLLRLAIARLAVGRVRALLTMLGVIIGVASVIALVAVGQGASSGITDRLQSLGTNLLTVTPGATVTSGVRGAAGSATSLTTDDATAIKALQNIAAVAPELNSQQVVVAGSQNTTTSIVGTTSDYPAVFAYAMWQGSFLTDLSNEQALRIAVLGATTADNLGLGASDVGTTILIKGLPFEVVGILQPKGGSGFQNPDDQVLVPLSTARRYLVGGTSVRSIGVSVATPEAMNLASAEIESTLRTRHSLAAAANDDFTIQNQAQLLDTVSSVTGTLTLLLAGIASISLIVGGIGIMNIMLVSVRERTREIGIRKAIGARRRDILAQFLVEALALSLLGGLIGAVIGTGASVAIDQAAGWKFTFNPSTLALALGFSAAVGVVFGVWPARQAAALDPIVALRYE
jgi:putative ABC transport system permease protein